MDSSDIDNLLILIGGCLPPNIPNLPRFVQPMRQLLDMSVLNVGTTGKQNWCDLAPPNRPLNRFNFAGCALESLKCIIIDGGRLAIDGNEEGDIDVNSHSDQSRQTFILDMEKNASWHWSTRVNLQGYTLPPNRNLHQMVATGSDQFIMTALSTRIDFIHGQVIVSESNIETGQKHRQFTILLTRINLPAGSPGSSRIPNYLQGARFSLIGDIIYWLSPASKGKQKPGGNSLCLYRARVKNDEMVLLPPSPPIVQSTGQHITCLFGYAPGRSFSGILVFGGAALTESINHQYVWRDLTNLRSVPISSNEMFFLQF